MKPDGIKRFFNAHRSALVWSLRVAVGLLFVVSGLVKSIDLWGFVYKIEEYLNVWGVSQPRSLVEMAALTISGAEFIGGAMLMVGCYRRTAVWGLTAMMVVMLPLTAYIYIDSPVSDCGCFGDFIHMSNGATFVKNIFITAALLCLLSQNRRVAGLIHPYLQWIAAVACGVFVAFVGLYGSMVQPLVDFRSFSPGTDLCVNEESSDGDDVEFEFIYEKNGETRCFTTSNLPDSTWRFVDRVTITGNPDAELNRTEFRVTEDGETVTEEVVGCEGEQVIIILPQYERADVSYTYIINELQKYVESRGGNMFEAASINSEDIDKWRDLSMATYPIYQGESVMLKEMARGVMAAVYVKDGRIEWKRTLGSIDADLFDDASDDDGGRNVLDELTPLNGYALTTAGVILLAILLILAFPSQLVVLLKRRRKSGNVTAGEENNANTENNE